MSLIFFIGSMLGLFLAIMTYYSHVHNVVKASCLVIYTVLSLIAIDFYVDSLGSPIKGFPKYDFIYVHHVVNGDDITLWTFDDEKGHKLYLIEFDKETAKKLNEAQKRSKERTQKGSFKSKRKTSGLERIETVLEIDDFENDNEVFTK